MKVFTKLITAVLIISQVFFGVSAFAADDEENDIVGAPEIMVVNGPTFDVNAGQQNEIEILLRNTGAYKASGITVTTSLADVSENPFTISYVGKDNQISELSPRAEKKVRLLVDVDKNAPSKSYALTMKFTYFNRKSEKFDRTDTIYLRVKNGTAAPNYQLENISLNPKSISPGDSAVLSTKLFNIGPLDLYDLEVSLTDLDPQGLSTEGLANMNLGRFYAGTEKTLSFNIVANPNMESGSYPVSIKLTYADMNGKTFEDVHKFYVNVGGTGGLSKPAVEILNLSDPKGTYGVNQNFNINFNLRNVGETSAKNVKVTVNPSEGIVPKSTSIKTIKELPPNVNSPVQFTLAPTSAAASKNHSVEIVVEYESGGKDNVTTFKQYVGVNVYNPDKGADGESKSSKPKIIVSKYECDPLIVLAGEEFNLDMELLNTHVSKPVKNIKMFLTLSEETSTETAKTGNIFTPVDSSNTFYFDSIPSKGTVNQKIKLYTVPDAQPKTYTLTVNFEYEDMEGNEYTAKELLGINVQQPTEIQVGDIFVPDTIEVGMPINLSFELYNIGKVAVSNLMISLEGDIQTSTKNTYLGNFDSGNSQYYDNNFSFMNTGENKFSIKISYDDPSGETFEKVQEYTVNVTEAMMPEGEIGPDGMPIDPNAPQGGGKAKVIGIVLVVIIIVGAGAYIFKKKHDAKKEQEFLLGDDEDEDLDNQTDTESSDTLEDENKKGNDVDEQP